MFVFVTLATNNQILNGIMKVPLLGPLIIIFYAFLPLTLVGAYGDLTTGSAPQVAFVVGGLAAIAWSYYLQANGTVIKILLVPAWIFGVLFTAIFLLVDGHSMPQQAQLGYQESRKVDVTAPRPSASTLQDCLHQADLQYTADRQSECRNQAESNAKICSTPGVNCVGANTVYDPNCSLPAAVMNNIETKWKDTSAVCLSQFSRQ